MRSFDPLHFLEAEMRRGMREGEWIKRTKE